MDVYISPKGPWGPWRAWCNRRWTWGLKVGVKAEERGWWEARRRGIGLCPWCTDQQLNCEYIQLSSAFSDTYPILNSCTLTPSPAKYSLFTTPSLDSVLLLCPALSSASSISTSSSVSSFGFFGGGTSSTLNTMCTWTRLAVLPSSSSLRKMMISVTCLVPKEALCCRRRAPRVAPIGEPRGFY